MTVAAIICPEKVPAKEPSPKRSTPRPNREPLNAAERAIAEAERRHETAQLSLAREIDPLRRGMDTISRRACASFYILVIGNVPN